MADRAGDQRQQVRRERRIFIANVAIQLRALCNLLRNVEIAARIDDRIEPAGVRLRESDCGDGNDGGYEDRCQLPAAEGFISDSRLPTPDSVDTHSFIVSGSTPRLRQKST